MSDARRYEIVLHPEVDKALRRLAKSDRKLAQRFDEAIQEISNDPYPAGVTVLKHKVAYDLCRVKVGKSWRLVYGVVNDRLVVLLLDATSREGAYRNLDTLLTRLDEFFRG
jgi:mRNA-degrading endonuclease RelE of RelBE toxin-antitoxin system